MSEIDAPASEKGAASLLTALLSKEFWTSAKGLLAVLTGLLGTGAAIKLAPPEGAPGQAQALKPPPEHAILLSNVANHRVPETASYLVQDDERQLRLEIHEVQGKKGRIVASLAAASGGPAVRKVVARGDSSTFAVDSRSYVLEVHQIVNRKDDDDEAVVSLRRR